MKAYIGTVTDIFYAMSKKCAREIPYQKHI